MKMKMNTIDMTLPKVQIFRPQQLKLTGPHLGGKHSAEYFSDMFEKQNTNIESNIVE